MGALSVALQGSAAAGWFVAAAWLAGYSESSQGRWSARVVAAFAVLVLGTLAVQLAADASGHSLVMIVPFALGTALAVLAGATKFERALQQTERDRALRRAKGLLAGAFLSLVALSLATVASALATSGSACWVWLHALPIVSGVACVFAGRARWLGLAALAEPWRALGTAVLVVVALSAARLSRAPAASAESPKLAAAAPNPASPQHGRDAHPETRGAHPEATDERDDMADEPPHAEAPPPLPSAARAEASGVAAAPVSPAPSSAAPAGELRLEFADTRNIFEADARGGMERRIAKLEACAAEQSNLHGTLKLRVGIDDAGSVKHAAPIGGDLLATPLADCLLGHVYRMGFASPRTPSASFTVTIHVASR